MGSENNLERQEEMPQTRQRRKLDKSESKGDMGWREHLLSESLERKASSF